MSSAPPRTYTTEEGTRKEGEINRTYEIVMVSIGGVLLLVAVVIFALLVTRKFQKLRKMASYHYTSKSTISLDRNSCDGVLTAEFSGPATIFYIPEPKITRREDPVPKLKLSREALLYISLMACINLPDIQDEPSEI
ncbi:hypothetical protein NDU88_006250 [Pleurodeles waltl]|uniref:Uncharacterized protein n=1 Tax=Pleurodeles waltl TaxID=8319 RepID=A0AAV7WA21_PLEWA|nr:hypothetical protein NDU88_006250 [Pleurodeles waltl]